MKKVITLRNVMLHFLNSIMVCKSRIVYDPSVLSYAINHIQEYNRVNVKDVVVLGSSKFYSEENNVIKDIYDIASQNETYVRFSSESQKLLVEKLHANFTFRIKYTLEK